MQHWQTEEVTTATAAHFPAATMLSSPAKRRKITETISIDVNRVNTDLDQPSKPTTPSRASYLSPTKASLARSHPHLAHQNQRRSLTEPRGRKLRDDLLKAKPTPEGVEPPASTAEEKTTNSQELETLPPVSTERDKPKETSTAPRPEPRNSLRDQELATIYPATRDDFLQPAIIPKLVPRFEGATPARRVSPPNRQPGLPPTPVELGWEEPPERPRGLSSSSPRGSRSGSGNSRLRLRQSQSNTSSPLKPSKRQRVVQDIHDHESEAEMAEQEPRPEPVAQAAAAVEELPDELREKQMALNNLRSELAALKKASIKLERAVKSNEVDLDWLSDQDSFKQISQHQNGKPKFNTSFEQLVTDGKEVAKYLDLFAPAGLQLNSNTSTRVVKSQPKVVHRLTVAAPPPWPPHAFSAAFDVIADAETAKVENLVWIDSQIGKTQSVGVSNELFRWLDTSIKADLCGCNVGVLIWGLSQYFENAVQRAKTLWRLSSKYMSSKTGSSNDSEADSITTIPDGKPLDEDQATVLTRFLTRSQMTFDLPIGDSEGGIRTRRGKKSEPKIMIHWNIDLTWNGVAKNVCEVVPSGIPDESMRHVKDLFGRLHPLQGLEGAFDAVYDLIKGQQDVEADTATAESRQGSEIPGARAKGRGIGKKRMRLS